MNDRVTDLTEENASTDQEISFQDLDQSEEPNKHPRDALKEEEQRVRGKRVQFFRIWFGLKKSELIKTAIGSFAAAVSGISKPFFGYFIITIGVAYYKEDAKQRVGLYSIAFSLIGLLSLFTHTLQHYFFGVIGEKAMTNLRQALYSGICYSNHEFTSFTSSTLGGYWFTECLSFHQKFRTIKA